MVEEDSDAEQFQIYGGSCRFFQAGSPQASAGGMTSITAADLKLGGRIVAACDAIASGHLNRAAGIFAEIADDLNNEALTTTGLLAPDEDDWSAPLPEKPRPAPAAVPTADLQMCSRNVHAFGQPDPTTGWRVCGACGVVNIAPPDGGPIDIGARG